MYNAEQKDFLVNLLQQLIKQPGFSGDEKNSADILEKAMKELNYDEVHRTANGDVVGVINGKQPGPTLLFDGHIDVVPVGALADWSVEPHGGLIKDGYMWGRGTCDMKSGVAAQVCAAGFANREKVAGKVVISCSVAEEILIGRALHDILKKFPADKVLITEPTGLKFGINERGRAGIEIETFGKVAHSSRPELGDNAVYRMMEAISSIRNMPRAKDAQMGEEVIALVDIRSTPYPGNGSVPDYCRTFWESRILPGETREGFLNRWNDATSNIDPDKIKIRYSTLTRMTYTGNELVHEDFLPGIKLEESHPFYRQVKNAIEVSGVELQYYNVPYGSNGLMSGGVFGIPTLILGAGDIDLAHKPDERIKLEDVFKATEIYQTMIETNQEI